jgi:predicted aconitase with swiveling domain
VSRPGRAQQGRVIYRGRATGPALTSPAPLSFFGGFDLCTGVVTERGHPLEGQCVAGRVLVFPTGTGSTVGAFALLRMARSGVGPAALVMGWCDTTVAVGAIIAEIPCVDRVDISVIADGETIIVADSEVCVA